MVASDGVEIRGILVEVSGVPPLPEGAAGAFAGGAVVMGLFPGCASFCWKLLIVRRW